MVILYRPWPQLKHSLLWMADWKWMNGNGSAYQVQWDMIHVFSIERQTSRKLRVGISFFSPSQITFSSFICFISWSRVSRRTFCLIAFIARVQQTACDGMFFFFRVLNFTTTAFRSRSLCYICRVTTWAEHMHILYYGLYMLASRDSENRDPSSVRASNALCDFFPIESWCGFPCTLFTDIPKPDDTIMCRKSKLVSWECSLPNQTTQQQKKHVEYCSVLHSGVEEMCAKNEFRFSSRTVFRGHNAKKFKERKVQMVQRNERLGIHYTRWWITRRFCPSGTQTPLSVWKSPNVVITILSFILKSVLRMGGFRSLGENEVVDFESKNSDKGVEASFVTGPNSSDLHGSAKNRNRTKRFRKTRWIVSTHESFSNNPLFRNEFLSDATTAVNLPII